MWVFSHDEYVVELGAIEYRIDDGPWTIGRWTDFEIYDPPEPEIKCIFE
jgi:hypothetical protein